KRLGIATQIEEDDVWGAFGRIRRLVTRNGPLLDRTDKAGLLQAGEKLRGGVPIAASDARGQHSCVFLSCLQIRLFRNLKVSSSFSLLARILGLFGRAGRRRQE